METVVQSPADAELHLLTDWGDADASARRKKAVVGTVLVHVVVIAGLISVPASLVEPEKPHEATHITILEPVTQLTQKAPNKGKVNKEFESRLETPRTAVQAPVAPLATKPKPKRRARPSYRPLPPPSRRRPRHCRNRPSWMPASGSRRTPICPLSLKRRPLPRRRSRPSKNPNWRWIVYRPPPRRRQDKAASRSPALP